VSRSTDQPIAPTENSATFAARALVELFSTGVNNHGNDSFSMRKPVK